MGAAGLWKGCREEDGGAFLLLAGLKDMSKPGTCLGGNTFPCRAPLCADLEVSVGIPGGGSGTWKSFSDLSHYYFLRSCQKF